MVIALNSERKLLLTSSAARRLDHMAGQEQQFWVHHIEAIHHVQEPGPYLDNVLQIDAVLHVQQEVPKTHHVIQINVHDSSQNMFACMHTYEGHKKNLELGAHNTKNAGSVHTQ